MGALASLKLAIRDRLDNRGGPAFAVLDFDNTCIVNDVAEATLAYICRNQLLRRDDLLPSRTRHCDPSYHQQVFRRYYELLHRGEIQSACLLCARVFAGFKRDEAENVVNAAIDAEGSIPWASELYGVPIARGLGVRPALRGLIDFSEANAVQVWIVSASPEMVVRTAMKRFGLPGKLIALRNKTDDSVISMEFDAPYSIGEGKVDCIKTFIDAGNRPLFGIGDSMHDLPMIEYADIHAVVDCGNALTQEAPRRGWFILPSRARPLAIHAARQQIACFPARP
jgi:phosphoserine phosphatase